MLVTLMMSIFAILGVTFFKAEVWLEFNIFISIMVNTIDVPSTRKLPRLCADRLDFSANVDGDSNLHHNKQSGATAAEFTPSYC